MDFRYTLIGWTGSERALSKGFSLPALNLPESKILRGLCLMHVCSRSWRHRAFRPAGTARATCQTRDLPYA